MKFISNKQQKGLTVEDYTFLLQLYQEKLEIALNQVGIQLLNTLMNNNFPLKEEIDKIRVLKSTDHAQGYPVEAFELLQHVTKDQSHLYPSFFRALEQIGQKKIVQSYLTFEALQNAMNATQDHLAKYYKEHYYDHQFTWNSEGHVVNLCDIHVPLQWRRYAGEGGRVKPTKLNHYSEIFNMKTKNESHKVKIRGAPFSGKTIFTDKLCYDWATMVRDEENFPASGKDWLMQFSLVLRMTARAIKPNSTLGEVLSEQLELSEEHLLTISWLCNTHPNKVLLIFDGLEKYNEGYCPELTEILQGTLLPDVNCIVTCRSSGAAKLQNLNGVTYSEVEMHRFERKDVTQYIDNYFSRNTDRKEISESLLGHIYPKDTKTILTDVVDMLQKVAKVPGLLEILCSIFKTDPVIFERRYELVSTFIISVFKRWEFYRRGRNDLTTSQIISNFTNVMMKLGELASMRDDDGLCSSFSVTQIKTLVGAEALEHGLLSQPRKNSRFENARVSFHHTLIRDWFASYYIGSEYGRLKEYAKFCSEIDTFYNDISVLQFLACRLSMKQSYTLCRLMLKTGQERNTGIKGMLKMHSSIEILKIFSAIHCDPEKNFPTKVVRCGNSCIVYQFPNFFLIGNKSQKHSMVSLSEGTTFSNDIHFTSDTAWDGNKSIVPKMNIPLTEDIKDLVFTVGYSATDEEKKFSHDTVIAVVHKRLEVHITGTIKVIRNLVFDNNCSLHSINSVDLPDKMNITLVFRNTNTENVVSGMATVLPRVEELKVHSCKVTPASLHQLAIGLRDNVSEYRGAGILDIKNSNLRNCGRELGQIVALAPCMTFLSMDKCSLVSHDIKQLTEGVLEFRAYNPLTRHLSNLYLSHNDLSGSGRHLGKLVECVPRLKHLDLSSCCLDKEDVRDFRNVVEKLQELPELQEVNLQENNLHRGGKDLGLLIVFLSVRKVDLDSCRLDDNDVENIYTVQQQFRSQKDPRAVLEDVSVENNCFRISSSNSLRYASISEITIL